MNWSVEFTPFFPASLLMGLAIVAGLLAIILLALRMRAAGLRVLTLLLLLGALANPVLREEDREQLPSIAVVVSDESESHTITGRQKLTRAVKSAIAETLEKRDRLQLNWVTTRSLEDKTNLFADISKALETIPPERLAGIIIISDGQVHDVPQNIKALGLSAPVHLLIPGRQQEFDRRLEVVESPRYGIVGTSRRVTVKVRQEGQHENQGQLATLKISQANRVPQILQVEVGKEISFDFHFPHAGQNIVELDLAGVPGEMTFVNNRLVLMAKGVRENLRVLLVSGEPNPGERTWRNLLKSDAAVDLVHFTILRPPEKQDGTPINQLSLIAFPTRELFSEKLSSFDLIIFDRYKRRGVLPRPYLDNIARYVEGGGAVLMGVGEAFTSDFYSLFYTPLGKVLPARPTGRRLKAPYRATITEAGLRHPVTRALDGTLSPRPKWGKWYSLIESQARRGQVVMEGMGKPLLVLDRVGKGRVAMLMSDHAWLWARGHDGGGPFTNLLRRIAHWSMKEPDLEEEYLKAEARGRTLLIERRTTKEKATHVEITSPVGKKTVLPLKEQEPGLWTARYKAPINGLYRLKSGRLRFVTHIGRLNAAEHAGVVATAEKLRPVLATTGGGLFWLGKKNAALLGKGDETSSSAPRADAVIPRLVMMGETSTKLKGENWLGLKQREAYLVKGIKMIPLLNGFLALVLLLGFLSLTWWREGR